MSKSILISPILRGLSVMILVILQELPSIEKQCSLAAIPIIVNMQLPSAVATKSVGEKYSPLPLLSGGASVMIILPDLK
jgi:hypothetical protein